jgi:pantoate--beta-alanine ligase
VQPGSVAETFEGRIRPGHFQGVLTVVSKLFHFVTPEVAVFGQKDAQQLFLIRRMVADLGFPVEIIAAETSREQNGLARSSRNIYLKEAERKQATVLFRALLEGEHVFRSGNRSLKTIEASMVSITEEVPALKLDYATAVASETFTETDPLSDSTTLIIAGKLGSVRLIDNITINEINKKEPRLDV